MSDQSVPESKIPALFMGQPEQTTALARFRTSKELSIHAKRIMKMDPGKGNNKLTFDEALMVAGASLGNNLDYIMGELHWWIQGKDNYRQLVIMRGRDGTERQAHEAANRAGTQLRPPRYYQLNKNQMEALAIPLEDLAIEAMVQDRTSYNAWLDAQDRLKALDWTREEVQAEVGDAPSTRGIGIVSKIEMDARDNPRWTHKCETNNWQKVEHRGFADCPDCGRESYAKPIKFSNVELARKRALTAAQRHWAARIDPSEMAAGASANLDDYAIDGEWRDVSIADMTGEQLENLAGNADSLYGEGAGDHIRKHTDAKQTKKSNSRPYSPETIKSRMIASVDEYKGTRKSDKMLELAVWQLNECFAGDEQQNDKRRSVLAYLFEKDSAKDLSGAEMKSIIQWLDSKEDDKGDYLPSMNARAEAIQIVVTRMKEQGQQELL